MSIKRIEGQGHHHKITQVDANHAPGENKKKLHNLITRTSRPVSGKERVTSLINRANLISTGSSKKVIALFNAKKVKF